MSCVEPSFNVFFSQLTSTLPVHENAATLFFLGRRDVCGPRIFKRLSTDIGGEWIMPDSHFFLSFSLQFIMKDIQFYIPLLDWQGLRKNEGWKRS